MAFPVNMPLGFAGNLPVNLAIISSFAVNASSRDGDGCGGENGGRSPFRSQAYSRQFLRSGAAGTAAEMLPYW
jgi:hypothetical protein